MSPSPTASAAKPVVLTGPATQLGQNAATLTGTVNPAGAATTYVFEYGLTSAYGVQTSPKAAGSGADAVAASADLTGLQPGTSYHYRLVATNAAGSSSGADATSTTLAPMFAPAGLSLSAKPKRDRLAPYRFALKGRLALPPQVSAAQGCAGTIAIVLKRKTKTVSASAPLSSTCTYRRSVRLPKGFGPRGKLQATARFAGNAVLTKASRSVPLRFG